MTADERIQVLLVLLAQGAFFALALLGTFRAERTAAGVLGLTIWRGASARHIRSVSTGFLVAITLFTAFTIYALATRTFTLRGGERAYGLSDLLGMS